MGCVYSNGRGGLRVARTSNNGGPLPEGTSSIALNQRSFHVFNVDEHGNEMHEGAIEVTASDLIYKHVNDPLPIYWPLCSLRKYGYNADLFSFVCGRRCPTGPGIYAFKCAQALELFEVLDESLKGISSANMTANTSPGVNTGAAGGGTRNATATATTNQWPQYRQISNVSLVSCRSPIPLTSNTSVAAAAAPPVMNSSTIASSHTSKILTAHGNATATTANANENVSATVTSDVDNPKSPAYYVNVSTCDAVNNHHHSNVTGGGGGGGKMVPPTSQYVNSEAAEVFASVQLACASNTSTTAASTTVTDTSTDHVNNSTSPCELKNCCDIDKHHHHHHDITMNNTSGLTKSIHSVHSASPDANSNITSNNRANESLSYILLDLDSYTSNANNTGNSVYVTTEPVTPVTRSPKEEVSWTIPESTVPSSSLHNSNSNTFKPPYAQIDFEKTDALNTAASIKKM